ncbi:glucoamylase family protein [Mucilaginibacter sp. UR6-11]|uniref:glucoamylase family protein n=1 Tax=Mucilaginibacter sp. UR6-11 TaxID=1435644 RepID=UPI001E34DF5E|nr:glucoamylase family protein [Mucilaginibacter sp. UR6-11]MCC8426849.1 beta-glucosidase [Mucilaginibacter sp. UR6-11]
MKKLGMFICFLLGALPTLNAQGLKPTPIAADLVIHKNLTDNQLLNLVQKQTFRYFWDFAHPVSGMARERSTISKNFGDNVVTTGGTGFGIMATIVAADRKFIARKEAAAHTLKIIDFLLKADRFHGAYPHWLNGETGKVIPFSKKDDGADIVETSYLFQGLLTAQQYYNANIPIEKEIRTKIKQLWDGMEWNWFTHEKNVLYWHWSPNYTWDMNMPIKGWNECLITYILAASSPTHAINKAVYTEGWTGSNTFTNGKTYYNNIILPLGPDYGGPLFWTQYSFMGLNPQGLTDQYADYWQQVTSHTLINRQYCIENPKQYKGYGANCWGLTASDSWQGYSGHSPTNDLGVITPTAALSAFPYAPQFSMQALRHFYQDLGPKIWGEYGFVDAFSEQHNWYAKSYLAIDQGPIIVMIENYRSGLLWNLFMRNADVKTGLKKLDFKIDN